MGKALASTTIELEGAKTIQFQPDNMEGVDSSNLYKICKGYITTRVLVRGHAVCRGLQGRRFARFKYFCYICPNF